MRRYITTEVEVSVDDLIDALDEGDIEELYESTFPDRKVSVPFHTAGDIQPDQYVDRAYHAARSMGSVPREIEDMFWHVFGKAL